MEFDLDDAQRMLDQSLRAMLADRMPLERLKKVAAEGGGLDSGLWQSICELGLPGLLVPEQHGGSGLSVLDAAVAAEALGHAAAPSPFISAAVMAPLAFRASASAGQQAEWLPRIAGGQARLAVAFAGLAGQTGRAEAQLDGGKLSGTIEGVADAIGATHVLVYLPDGRAALTAIDGKGVALERIASLDPGRPLARLSFASAPAEVLDAANDARVAALGVLDAGRVMLAADTLGAAQSMLDKAVAYAKERVQFGRVIGSFQGVKHTCAEMAAALEPCRAMVWHAAHAQDALPAEARAAACHAKAHLAEVGREVARLSTEVHGGMGFTDLLGLHYWFKRIAFNRHVLGGPERCREEAAVAQGWA
jgi:alkylation response protein AidB-like acyl-CoA dehydrogenase